MGQVGVCIAAVQSQVESVAYVAGLGHLLGLDTHDVGGYAPGTPPRINKPGLSSLRTARSDNGSPCPFPLYIGLTRKKPTIYCSQFFLLVSSFGPRV